MWVDVLFFWWVGVEIFFLVYLFDYLLGKFVWNVFEVSVFCCLEGFIVGGFMDGFSEFEYFCNWSFVDDDYDFVFLFYVNELIVFLVEFFVDGIYVFVGYVDDDFLVWFVEDRFSFYYGVVDSVFDGWVDLGWIVVDVVFVDFGVVEFDDDFYDGFFGEWFFIYGLVEIVDEEVYDFVEVLDIFGVVKEYVVVVNVDDIFGNFVVYVEFGEFFGDGFWVFWFVFGNFVFFDCLVDFIWYWFDCDVEFVVFVWGFVFDDWVLFGDVFVVDDDWW